MGEHVCDKHSGSLQSIRVDVNTAQSVDFLHTEPTSNLILIIDWKET